MQNETELRKLIEEFAAGLRDKDDRARRAPSLAQGMLSIENHDGHGHFKGPRLGNTPPSRPKARRFSAREGLRCLMSRNLKIISIF